MLPQAESCANCHFLVFLRKCAKPRGINASPGRILRELPFFGIPPKMRKAKGLNAPPGRILRELPFLVISQKCAKPRDICFSRQNLARIAIFWYFFENAQSQGGRRGFGRIPASQTGTRSSGGVQSQVPTVEPPVILKCRDVVTHLPRARGAVPGFAAF